MAGFIELTLCTRGHQHIMLSIDQIESLTTRAQYDEPEVGAIIRTKSGEVYAVMQSTHEISNMISKS